MAIELGVGYVSVVPSTGSFKQELQKQLDGMGFDSQFSKHGKAAGRGFGKSFGSELSSSLPGVGAIRQTLSGYEGAAAKTGALAGKALGTAFKAAATAGIAAAGYTLFKGFERYSALDAATNRLNNLNRTFTTLGKTGVDVQKVMKDVEASVQGTPYSLSDAFTQATNAIASGVTDIKQYMTNIADAAAFAGDDIANIGQAFTQVINQGKVDAGILQNQLRNLPIKAWLNEVYGAQVDVTKAISDGQIGIEQLEYVIERFAAGMAKTAGDTIAGSIENMNTAFARLGANILAALFGGPTEDATNGLKSAIDAITNQLNDLNAWVLAHRDDIKDAFDSATEAVETFIDIVKGVKGFLDEIGVGAGEVVTAFVAWKTIAGVAALSKALGGIDTMLGTTLPASAAASASKISSAFGPVLSVLSEIERIKNSLDSGDTAGAILGVDPFLIDRGNQIGQALGRNLFPWIVEGTPTAPPGVATGSGDMVTGSDGKTYKPVPTGTPGAVPIPGKNQWGIAASSSSPSGGREPGWGGTGTPMGPPPALQPGSGGSAGSSGGSSSVPKPVVPFDQTLPGWAANTPMTESFFGAASSWLDQRHDVAEQQAYLNQLEQDNTATAEEILDAKNDLAKKQRDMHAQDMRLQEARVKAYEEFYKTGEKQKEQFTSLSDSLGSIVQLDQDLGISRGLVGMAENLLKFLAGLAAAPIKGLLAGAQAGMEAKLPDGWLGKSNPAMAASGSFGPGTVPTLGMVGRPGGIMPINLNNLWNSALAPAAAANVPKPARLRDSGLVPSGPQSRHVAGLLLSMFPGIQGEIGGSYMPRSQGGPSAPGTHDAGLSIDIPIGASDAQRAMGDSIEKFLQENAKQLGIVYTIWKDIGRQTGVNPARPAGTTFDSGGHQDHIDVMFDGKTFGSAVASTIGIDPSILPLQRKSGGSIPGSGLGDKVPVLAEPGEHMLSRDDVQRMGGQSGVFAFRNALRRQTGGPIPLTPEDELYGPQNTDPALNSPQIPGQGMPAFDQPAQIKPTEPGPASTQLGPKPGTPSVPAMLGSDGQPIIGPDGRPIGIDGNPLPQPTDAQAAEFDKRLAGFIPQAAKANTVAGTSNLSRIWMMGAEVANSIIDQAASTASTAASLAVAGGTMGVGAAGGSQAAAAGAQFLIGLGTEAAKRGISYGAQMGGIVSDAIVEQLFPFGAPRFIGFDSAGNGINALIDNKRKAGIYDSGGILEPGGVAVNMSSRPESVLTQQQWDAMSQTSTAARGYGINIENVHVADVDEMSRSLSARQRLAAMQYTGRPGM